MLARNVSVAILGAGHGGLALAGYLAAAGHRVALWNRSPEPVRPVAELGGIRLSGHGAEPTLARVSLATCDIAPVLFHARRVLVAVPASAHADVARRCAAHLRDGQTVLLLPGRTGGALEFGRVLRESGCRARVLLGEANTFPLASRCVGPASAVVFGTKAEVRASALPAIHNPELMASWRPLLPMLQPARSVLHTGLSNLGAILHPVIALGNAQRISRAESFDFYTDGVTTRVAEALAAADAERLSIAACYGVKVQSLTAWIASAYQHRAGNVLDAVGGNPAYVGIKAPTTLVHRYLLEDVPTGLLPLIELGNAAGLALPTLRGLVAHARVVLGDNLWQSPRGLAGLGLEGMGPRDIRSFVQYGEAAVAPVAATGGLRMPHFATELGLVPLA